MLRYIQFLEHQNRQLSEALQKAGLCTDALSTSYGNPDPASCSTQAHLHDVVRTHSAFAPTCNQATSSYDSGLKHRGTSQVRATNEPRLPILSTPRLDTTAICTAGCYECTFGQSVAATYKYTLEQATIGIQNSNQVSAPGMVAQDHGCDQLPWVPHRHDTGPSEQRCSYLYGERRGC